MNKIEQEIPHTAGVPTPKNRRALRKYERIFKAEASLPKSDFEAEITLQQATMHQSFRSR